ncbi:MAG: SRPBCC domain-containing protein [Deferribacteres bacterium]|nr:SRPBCC domain-containing protein [candidate division KSB1 bacterium]MCB9500962.1 SRPBCC domain-containing protein [Deferribacteres bacterium]
MNKIRQDFHVHASIETVFRALTDPILIEQWSESRAIMDSKIGTRFSLFNGYIIGQNLEIGLNKKIVQNWRARNWKDDSLVSMNLIKETGGTKIELRQEGIPDQEYVSIQQGWNKFYLGKLQRFFGNGRRL